MAGTDSNGSIPYKFQRASSQICPTPKEELLEAIQNNEILKLERLLSSRPDLLTYHFEEEDNNTALLLACRKDDIKGETVGVLLKYGADKRDSNSDGWNALHFAAQKTDYRTLQEILKIDSGNIINVPAGGLNALHILIRYGDSNSKNFFKCAKLLIEKGINLNHGDKNNKTTLYWAKKKQQSDIVDLIESSLNSSETGNEDSNSENTKQLIIKYLKECKEDDVLNVIANNEDLVDETDSDSTLLQIACTKRLKRAVEHLLAKGADVNKTWQNKKKPIEIATENGFTDILHVLLTYGAQITTKELCICLQSIDSTTHSYKECFNMLIDNIARKNNEDEKLLILNGKEDTLNYTPLHYAVRYADSDIIEKLLDMGASLGSKNFNDVMPIEDIDLKVLENHLDNCVKYTKMEKADRENFQVTFDYRSLVPPYLKLSKRSRTKYNTEVAMSKLNRDAERGNLKNELVSETEVIFYMSNSPEFKQLLKHPVITSFLFMKWRQIQWLFWANLIFYVFFLTSLGIYIFTDYVNFQVTKSSTGLKFLAQISYGVLFITLLLLILRELFQMIIEPKKYFKRYDNYLEIILIGITIVIVFCQSPLDVRKQLSSVAILLAALELVLILGQHPLFSTNVVMLRTVSFNFFRFLAWYSLLLVAFALSFYLLFTPNVLVENDASKLNNTEKDGEEEDTFFDDPYRSAFKTVIMLTGEFDAGSINFKTFPITSKIIFALFIFMITIILLNLLNGLAVSDTQSIKNDAELIGYISRAKHIRYVESMLLGNIIPTNLLDKISAICCCVPSVSNSHWKKIQTFGQHVCLFPKYLNYELVFYPNRRGLVELDREGKHFRKCFACRGVCLDRETVRRTQNIIRSRLENDNYDIKKLSNEIKELKELLYKLTGAIKQPCNNN